MEDVVLLVGFLVVVYMVVMALIFLRKKMVGNGKKKVEKVEKGGGEIMSAVFAGIAAYEESIKSGRTRKKRISIRGGRQGEASLWKISGRMGRVNKGGGE